MYALYSRSQRGHLFHFCRLVNVILPDTPNVWRKEKENIPQANKDELDSMVRKYEETLNP